MATFGTNPLGETLCRAAKPVCSSTRGTTSVRCRMWSGAADGAHVVNGARKLSMSKGFPPRTSLTETESGGHVWEGPVGQPTVSWIAGLSARKGDGHLPRSAARTWMTDDHRHEAMA
jgi:hypothetical protein